MEYAELMRMAVNLDAALLVSKRFVEILEDMQKDVYDALSTIEEQNAVT